VIEEILPPQVCAVDTTDDPDDAVLLGDEESYLGRSVDKRRREFTTARHCARQALAALGVPPVAIARGEKGEPRWPDGVVGSITHCDGYRAAAVGRSGEVLTVGIDAEPHGPLPDGVLDAVSLPAERGWVGELARDHPGVHWDRLLFCTKEAVYKAWYPLAQRWLGFEDAHVTVDPERGTFRARLLVPGPLVAGRQVDGFTGRWLATERFLVTAIALTTAG
jgi:4'-phosphopantetheinyl transferase EntD